MTMMKMKMIIFDDLYFLQIQKSILYFYIIASFSYFFIFFMYLVLVELIFLHSQLFIPFVKHYHEAF